MIDYKKYHRPTIYVRNSGNKKTSIHVRFPEENEVFKFELIAEKTKVNDSIEKKRQHNKMMGSVLESIFFNTRGSVATSISCSVGIGGVN